MRRVAFYYYLVPDRLKPGKTKRTPCRYNSEVPPHNGVPIESTVEWRNLPDGPDEHQHTSDWMEKGPKRQG